MGSIVIIDKDESKAFKLARADVALKGYLGRILPKIIEAQAKVVVASDPAHMRTELERLIDYQDYEAMLSKKTEEII